MCSGVFTVCCVNIIFSPCQTIRITAIDRKNVRPNVKNVGSYVVSRLVMACWMVAMVARRGSGGMAVHLNALRLTPGAKIVRRACQQARRHGSTSVQTAQLHVHRRGFGVAVSL